MMIPIKETSIGISIIVLGCLYVLLFFSSCMRDAIERKDADYVVKLLILPGMMVVLYIFYRILSPHITIVH